MKKAAIFDLDGLLIDSEIITYHLYLDLLGAYGQSFTQEEYARTYSGKTAVGNMQDIVKTYQLPISVQEGLDDMAEREKLYLEKGVALKPGARELLAYLKCNRYKILLASSSTRARAVGILEQNGIADYFDNMVFGVEIKNGKPHPDIFLKACEKSGEAPEACLVLEDSEAGIQAAHSAGIDVICIPDMKTPGEIFQAMAAEVLPSLHDVIDWLEQRK